MNRGGSWNNDAGNCRSANRNRNNPSNRNNNNGFRLALNSAGGMANLSFQTEQIVFQSGREKSRSAKSKSVAAWCW
ncbi:MAG: hypothetical protein WCI02_13185 [Planctomycetota bacterium]